MTEAWALVIVALITAVVGPAVTNRLLTKRVSEKVDEVHTAVTVNHHSSEQPTILDLLSDLQATADTINERLERGDQRMARNSDRIDRLETAIGLPPFPDASE